MGKTPPRLLARSLPPSNGDNASSFSTPIGTKNGFKNLGKKAREGKQEEERKKEEEREKKAAAVSLKPQNNLHKLCLRCRSLRSSSFLSLLSSLPRLCAAYAASTDTHPRSTASTHSRRPSSGMKV